jgi:hypothetical protein
MEVRMDAELNVFILEVKRPVLRLLASWKHLLAAVLLAGPVSLTHAQAVCEATEHGMRADGSDNVAAFTKTLAECAGRTIHIPAGTYTFSPTGFAVGFAVPTGTSVVGDGSQGGQPTVLRIADTGNFQGFLWVRNASNVTIRGIRFEGTAYESGCARHLDYGHAIYVRSDKGQAESVEGVTIAENLFHNFNGTGWVDISAGDDSPGIGARAGVLVTNNVFLSDAGLRGGCAASGLMSDIAAMVAAHGSDNAPAGGMIRNSRIINNTLDAGYVKEGIAIWAGTNATTIKSNAIADTGLRLPRTANPELGRYAVLVYNSAHERAGLPPNTVEITDNVITNPVSCGIYTASGVNLRIIGNKISGQTDRYDGTLLKGAIALNRGVNVTIQGNELSNNYIGISYIGEKPQLTDNKITVPAGGTGIKPR